MVQYYATILIFALHIFVNPNHFNQTIQVSPHLWKTLQMVIVVEAIPSRLIDTHYGYTYQLSLGKDPTKGVCHS